MGCGILRRGQAETRLKYRFDRFELDTARHELRRGGVRVDLQPKVLDVLIFLLEHPDRTLPRDEIRRAVWPSVTTTDASLVRCVHLLRKELGGRGGDEVVRTVRGRGYAMAVAVEVGDEGLDARKREDEAGSEAARPPRSRWRRFMLAAVLPCTGLLALVALARQERISEEPAPLIDPPATVPIPASPELPRTLTAYEFYLRGLSAALDAERDQLRIAISHYQRAVAIDPAFVAGYVALAISYDELWRTHDADDSAAGLLATAEAAAKRALELAPDDHGALTALARVRLNQRDWEASEASFRKALEMGDSPRARRDFAGLLMMLGRLDDARPHVERMLELEPHSARNQRAAGRFHLYRGEYEQAIPHLEKSLRLDPAEPFAPRLLASVHHYLGNDPASLDAFLRRVPAWLRTPLRSWEAVRGPGGALRLALRLDGLRVGDSCGEDPQGSAIAWAHLGETESMYACLEKAASRHLWYVQVEPVYTAYRSAPRFIEVLARAGFLPQKVALR